MWVLCFWLLAPLLQGAPTLRIAGAVLEPDGHPSAGAQVFLGSPKVLPPFGTSLEARFDSGPLRGELASGVEFRLAAQPR